MFKTRKSFLTLLTCFGLLLVFIWACKKDADVTPPDKPDETEEIIPGVTVGYGAELLDPAEYEKIPLIPEPLAPSGSGARIAKDPTPPAVYDFSSKMPPVRNQGRQGSCTSWAVVYAARSYYAVGKKGQSYFDASGKVDESRLFSPAFVYNQKKVAADCIKGSYIFSSLDLLRSTGVCSLEDMPYREEDCETKPSAPQIQAAASGKISGWGRIRINKDNFRKFLYYDYPIIIAQSVDEHLNYPNNKDATGEYIINRSTGSRLDAHAMVVVGYDDSRKAFKVQNSWGSSWANKGFIWVSYDVLEKVILEAYVMLTEGNSEVPGFSVIEYTGTGSWKPISSLDGFDLMEGSHFSVENKFYCFGNRQESRSVYELLVYDLASDKWATLGSEKPLGFWPGKCAVLGRKTYMILDDGVRFFEYDIDANKWTRKKDQASGRPNGIFFSHSGKLYYGLGGSGVSYTQSENTKLGMLWEYSVNTDSWTKISDMPLDWLRGSVRGYGIVDNKLFLTYSNGISGGEDGDNKKNSTMLYQYDFASRQWSEKARMAEYRFYSPGFTIGGSIEGNYYFYGSRNHGESYNPVFEHPNRLYTYHPGTNKWKEVKSSPQPYTHQTSTVLTIFCNNRLFVGYQNPNSYASNDYSSKWWVFTP